MKSAMYITAAPVGAVPKYIDPLEPTFIPSLILDYFISQCKKQSVLEMLNRENWKFTNPGGIALQFGYKKFFTHEAFNTLTLPGLGAFLSSSNKCNVTSG